MTIRERIRSVYQGKTPDAVPYMLDLSHWFYHRNRLPWDLSAAYEEPERILIDYHKKSGVGFYLPNLGSFYSITHQKSVSLKISKRNLNGKAEIIWRYDTPLGSIERGRIWEEGSYSWAISKWGVKTEHDLRILTCALNSRTYAPFWERYQKWVDYVGDCGVVYLPTGYSAMGQLLHYWMGVERTLYAVYDWPETMHEFVEQINENNLELINLAAESPAEIILMGDNFSGDIQPPQFFEKWSRRYYQEAIRRLHAVGKYVAVHIDGKLRGALSMIRDAGADCSDATTPAPMGDLTPEECRREAGPDLILSGGVPPNLWLPETGPEVFKKSVLDWLKLKRHSFRLIANAGDQVPPGASEEKIRIMHDLVEEYGSY